ncbi:tripartite motif-containing protein 66 [Boleophthalmus pectinirostris]|uniref:tripartite motif-containing protein 66 n=1 Tax=Boleophthalmus pectinirostris TaxID=150288 RepID=UPI0024332A0C|nr:tripartite motif-containing protein 66 [Boleophthalmus pectinirostris]
MEKSCSQCSEPTLAQSLCTQCNKWLCYQCTDVHQHHPSPAPAHYSDFHQATRPNASQCPELHQRAANSLPAPRQGAGSHPCPLLLCHSHRQEPLELFCESCDLLCCSSCHLSTHKNHRVVPIEKALQDQQWLFESLMVQVEERRSAVENNAKQIEERLHSVKIAHRKAENQIKMAKMIMMNELNKRANLLIEQLEKFSEDLQRRLEDYLQGAIEACGQMDHVQKFITWATSHHCTSPILFSREMISLQMQQFLEPPPPLDSLSPVKIKFNWDASYWTKQISTLGQLTVEDGNCPYPQSLSCPSILRPQPLSCLAPPPVCHRQDSSCGYKNCCEPQVCCLHGLPNPPDLSSLDKTAVDGPLFRSSLGLLSSRHWDTDSSSAPRLPISSSVSFRPTQAKCTHAIHPQPVSSHSLTASYLHQQQRSETLPNTQVNVEGPAHSQCQRKVSVSPSLPQNDKDVMSKDVCGERCHLEETCGPEGRELLDKEQTTGQQKQHYQTAFVPERARPVLTTKYTRDSKRSTSLEVPVTAPESGADVERSLLIPNPVCARREKRSQSIPAELAPASTTNPYIDPPPACPQSIQAAATDKHTTMDSRQRRASDGLLCVVKENSATMPPAISRRSPLLTYKTEADQSCTFVTKDLDFEASERCQFSNSVIRETQKEQGRPKVPVVCLERLKILVSQMPPQGRRQSDPLPASASNQEVWHDDEDEVGKSSAPPRTTHLLSTPKQKSDPNENDFNYRISQKSPSYVPQSYSTQDPRTPDDNIIQIDPDCDTDESDPNVESSSEAELECLTHEKSIGNGEMDRETDITGDSDPSLEYQAGSEEEQGRDSREGESEVEQADPFEEVESQSEVGSEQAQDSQCSIDSDLEVESEAETVNDEPQPLRSDQEDDPHIGPILIANPDLQSAPEDVQDSTEMESEDFCAVCLIGGDLLCCDNCPKVYHLSCHIPPLLSFPSGDWVCSLCRDVEQPEVEYDCENERSSVDHASSYGLAASDQRKCERLTLLILSNMLSAPFHEPVSPLARHYYQIIKRPMDLSVIRTKLNKSNSKHYNCPDQFVADVYLMFKNCAKFNYPDSEVAQAGRSLESFFNAKLKEVFGDRVFPGLDPDSDSDEYDEVYRSTEGFPWPERREQCHRKRKRRHSVKSRRQNF